MGRAVRRKSAPKSDGQNKGHDWLRAVLYVCAAGFFLSRVCASVQKLFENQMAFDEVVKDSPTIMYPSLTMCPSHNAPSRNFNVTEDYETIKTRYGLDKVKLFSDRSLFLIHCSYLVPGAVRTRTQLRNGQRASLSLTH